MGYNAVDIIDKAIKILNKRIEAYKKVQKENEDIPYVKIISKVVIKQAYETMAYYESVKQKANNGGFDEIDFKTYDQISFLVNHFNLRKYSLEFINARDYFMNLLDFQKDVRALYIDIQGRLVTNQVDVHKSSYKIMGEIIKYKDEEIKTLEKVLVNNM